MRHISLRRRLAAGAILLATGTVLTALTLYLGMERVAKRLDAALTAETRMERYAVLSTQVSSFLVITTEAVQTGLAPEQRSARSAPVVEQIHRTFDALRRDLELAVAQAETLGLDEQSRMATQSLGLARMEALLNNAETGLAGAPDDRDVLRAHIDTFASTFDPLLNQAVNTEALFRRKTLAGIETLRLSLERLAIAMALGSILMVVGFYFGLIRPQFLRLDRLRAAARQIGQEDFAVALPDTRGDEIGQLYAETNRMAAALATRQAGISAEWQRLNQTIAERTEALRSANARLEQTDENRRRFFADISHELRTPLTVILMEAQIGQKGGPDSAEAFATIESRTARLNRRIDDLLRVARSDTGELALAPQPLRLDDLAAEVVEEVAAECANAGMELICDPMPAITILGDPNWLRQVIVGLVRNAIRHARDGGEILLRPEVGVPKVSPNDGQARDTDLVGIAVQDRGPGLASGEHARLFDRFAQGNEPNAQGFGLGLALARWVVEAQGGDITLQSPAPDYAGQTLPASGVAPDPASSIGTKVSVRLPRVRG